MKIYENIEENKVISVLPYVMLTFILNRKVPTTFLLLSFTELLRTGILPSFVYWNIISKFLIIYL